jgi:hypothetical protein
VQLSTWCLSLLPPPPTPPPPPPLLLLLLLQVRIMYCEMLGHDVSFAYIPVLQMASDPNLLNKKVRGSRPHTQARRLHKVAILKWWSTVWQCHCGRRRHCLHVLYNHPHVVRSCCCGGWRAAGQYMWVHVSCCLQAS